MYFQEKWSNSTKTDICFETVKNTKIYLNSKKMDFRKNGATEYFHKFKAQTKMAEHKQKTGQQETSVPKLRKVKTSKIQKMPIFFVINILKSCSKSTSSGPTPQPKI